MILKVKVRIFKIYSKVAWVLKDKIMQKRTFFRIFVDNLILNNAFCKAIASLVNFCNEQSYYNRKKLKFLKKMPLNKTEQNNSYNKFVFKPHSKTGVDYR